MMRFLFKMAAKTGEDMSLPGGTQRGAQPNGMRDFYANPVHKM
jgi:hypothetical protein